MSGPVVIQAKDLEVISFLWKDYEVKLWTPSGDIIGTITGPDSVKTSSPIGFYSIHKDTTASYRMIAVDISFVPTSISIARDDEYLFIAVIEASGIDAVHALLVECDGPNAPKAWKSRLGEHKIAVLSAIETGNFSRLPVYKKTDQWKSRISDAKNNLDRKTLDTIEQISQAAATDINTIVSATKDNVASLKSLAKPAWKDRLDGSKSKMIEDAVARIKKLYEDGEAYIDTLPDASQDHAAVLFESSTDIVSKGFHFVTEALMAVYREFGDFVKGIWDQVTHYANQIVDIGKSVIDGITSLFG
ncbi:MAG: hypothetical protein JWR43_2857 [Phenylobacterium sp.]|jgi:hypothetical protein|nr:hypothetical protein [Phenylobacterium sp.]